MLKLLIVIVVVGVVTAATDTEWAVFKAKHGKVYDGDIDLIRRAIWEDNVKMIQSHNEMYAMGQTSFFMGENEFTDMTHDEFSNTMKGFLMPEKSSQPREQEKPFHPEAPPPPEWNWVKKGKVTPVKNQKGCNASYAFAAMDCIASEHAIIFEPWLYECSAQQAIDCTAHHGNHGCNGGTIDNVFKHVTLISNAKYYPYKAKVGHCAVVDPVATVTGTFDIVPRTEANLKSETFVIGPIAAGINGGLESFRHYKGGVYDDPNCNATHLDHAVLVVGYGGQGSHDYWLLKNSWGTSWGQEGYMELARNKNNTCGIASMASFPKFWAQSRP